MTIIKSDNSIKKMSYIYILSLLPLILYGFYKNGIYLYMKNYVNIVGLFKPLLFLISGASIGILVNIIYEKIINNSDKNIIDIVFSSFHLIYGILISCIVSINTNILLFIFVTFGILLISKFIKDNRINVIALVPLIIFLIMNITNSFSFLNIYESSNKFSMNAIDYLFGRGSGGIFTTNVIFLIISYIILYNSKIYKRVIPIFASITFLVLVIIYCLTKNDISNILNMLFTNGILFSFIYVSTDPITSSYTKKGRIIYGILVGLITFLLYLIQPALAVLGGILVSGILSSIIDIKFE